MKPVNVIIPILVLTISSLMATDDSSEPPANSSPSLVQITDDPKLPRVLLIGDSISMGYTLQVRALLSGVANVHRPPTNCGSTHAGVLNLDKWLGDGKWDVIHFNWGMHDLKYLSNGKQNVPIANYEKNLREIVSRLKKTGATLIFATTTPLPNDTTGVYERHAEEELKYNTVAVQVMKDNKVDVDDLHAVTEPQIAKLHSPDGVHFNSDGCKVLANQVAVSISKALDERKSTSAATK
ncbi:SGNH/GDSL hydrolase family protein [soil metagenome]